MTRTPVLSEAEEEILRIAITGHRPKDLWRNGVPIDLDPIIDTFLERAALRARDSGCTVLEIITGGALGADQGVASIVERTPLLHGVVLRNRIILPFPIAAMGQRWEAEDIERLTGLVERAGGAQIITDHYANWAYHARNAAMVDAASGLMAFWSGKRAGGTYACINYALRKGKPVWNALAGFAPLKSTAAA